MLTNCKLYNVSGLRATLHEFRIFEIVFHLFSDSDITIYFQFVPDFFKSNKTILIATIILAQLWKQLENKTLINNSTKWKYQEMIWTEYLY